MERASDIPSGPNRAPDCRELLQQQIDELLTMTPPPDSRPVSPAHMERLIDILASLGVSSKFLPQLTPSRHGGVGAEWHYREHSLQINVAEDGSVYAFSTEGPQYHLEAETGPDHTFLPDSFSQLDEQLRLMEQRVAGF